MDPRPASGGYLPTRLRPVKSRSNTATATESKVHIVKSWLQGSLFSQKASLLFYDLQLPPGDNVLLTPHFNGEVAR
jgi:hypothetical protein